MLAEIGLVGKAIGRYNLYVGGRVVLAPAPTPAVCFELIAAEKVTDTALVPPLLLLWLEAAASATPDLSSLKLIQVGGAKLIPEVARRVTPTLGATLQQVFGMAEGLVNSLVILAEPSLGLHPRDMDRIIAIMPRVRDAGNSLVVVEHDPQVMFAARALATTYFDTGIQCVIITLG